MEKAYPHTHYDNSGGGIVLIALSLSRSSPCTHSTGYVKLEHGTRSKYACVAPPQLVKNPRCSGIPATNTAATPRKTASRIVERMPSLNPPPPPPTRNTPGKGKQALLAFATYSVSIPIAGFPRIPITTLDGWKDRESCGGNEQVFLVELDVLSFFCLFFCSCSRSVQGSDLICPPSVSPLQLYFHCDESRPAWLTLCCRCHPKKCLGTRSTWAFRSSSIIDHRILSLPQRTDRKPAPCTAGRGGCKL